MNTRIAPVVSLFDALTRKTARCMTIFVVAVAAMFVSVSDASADDEKPKLTFKQDGADLVVSTVLTANGGPHVLWTNVIKQNNEVVLEYFVVHCSDRLYRHQKQVEVTWRIAGHEQGKEAYRVENRFNPSTAQLKALLPQLEALAKTAK
jgi:hypothetical protein